MSVCAADDAPLPRRHRATPPQASRHTPAGERLHPGLRSVSPLPTRCFPACGKGPSLRKAGGGRPQGGCRATARRARCGIVAILTAERCGWWALPYPTLFSCARTQILQKWARFSHFSHNALIPSALAVTGGRKVFTRFSQGFHRSSQGVHKMNL